MNLRSCLQCEGQTRAKDGRGGGRGVVVAGKCHPHLGPVIHTGAIVPVQTEYPLVTLSHRVKASATATLTAVQGRLL